MNIGDVIEIVEIEPVVSPVPEPVKPEPIKEPGGPSQAGAGRTVEMKTWTRDQLRGFLDHVAEDRMNAAYRLAAMTGMRRGEVLGTRLEDVDFERGRVAVRQALVLVDNKPQFSEPKTKRSKRSIPLDSGTVAALKAHRARQAAEKLAYGPGYQETGLIFTQEDGALLHPDSFTKAFERHARAAGLPIIRFHDLRHTFATLALQAGMHPKVVSDRLGHSTVSFTLDVYSHAVPAMEEEAAEAFAQLITG